MSHKQQPHLGNEAPYYNPIQSKRAMTDAGLDPKAAEAVAEQITDAHNKGRREFLDAIEKVCQRFEDKIDKSTAETNKRLDGFELRIDKLEQKIDKSTAETNKRLDKFELRIDKLEQKIDKSTAETNKRLDGFELKINQSTAETNKRLDRFEDKINDLDKDMRAMPWKFTSSTTVMFGIMTTIFIFFS